MTVRLPEELATRLHARAAALAPLGSLMADAVDVEPAWAEALDELATRLEESYPFPAPQYVGQMLKPPHPVAWAASALAMLLNQNNHALDGGPAGARLEREAVAGIAAMFGLPQHLGHLTASGTIANLEALWVARSLHPERAILSGANAHYTHARVSEVIGARHETLPQDDAGRLDLGALERRLAAGGVGTVVATLGTTSLGVVDRVDAIADLCAAGGARLHVDGAYGGFFTLLADGAAPGVDPTPFRALARADSIVVDPHKHGLQPYGCGCVLFADPGVGRLYAHESPYTYFTSDELHLGEISLECSRAGAAAAALWATLRALPLTREGLGSHLAGARAAGLALADAIRARPALALVGEPDLDIVCWFRRGASASAVSASTDATFDALAAAGWHVAKLRVETARLRAREPGLVADEPTVAVLRSCLMKPEHLTVVDALVGCIDASGGNG